MRFAVRSFISWEKAETLKDAIEKLSLSDSALQFTPENSPVLGFGVRVGFLGLLHMDIVRETALLPDNLEMHDAIIVITASIRDAFLISKDKEIKKVYPKVIW